MPHTPAEWKALGQDLALLGRRIFLVDLPHGGGKAGSGAAPPLLALHGFPTSSWDWSPIAKSLSQRGRLIAPDLLGFGLSEKPRGPYTIAEQADLVCALLEKKGLVEEPIDLLCHDLGDTVGCELLARRRALGGRGLPRIRRVVLLNGGLITALHRPRLVQRLLRSPLRRGVVALMGRGSFGAALSEVFGPSTKPSAADLDAQWGLIVHDGGLANYPELIAYIAERKAHRARWEPAITDLELPLRLIWGDADPVAPWAIAEEIQRRRPQTSVVRLEGIGHYPQLEAPEKVVQAIEEHLS